MPPRPDDGHTNVGDVPACRALVTRPVGATVAGLELATLMFFVSAGSQIARLP